MVTLAGYKRCTKCRRTLPHGEFNRQRHRPDGLQYWCKVCARKHYHTYIKANPKAQRDRWLKSRHGLNPEQYEELAAIQGDACAVCKEPLALKPRIDHCHNRKIIRGILCHHCNVALGHLRDDPTRIRALAEYVEHPPLAIPHVSNRKD